MTNNKHTNNLTDAELVSYYKESSNTEFVGVLFERYKSFVFYTSLKYFHDRDRSKDALMQIFEKLIEDLLKHEIGYFKAWLYRVVVNHCLMELRRDKRISGKKHEFQKDEMAIMENEPDFHLDTVENEKTIAMLKDGLQELNDEQQVCVSLFYIEQKSYQEIMDETGFTFKQVKSYIQNGKRNLKIYLERRNVGKTN